MSVCAEVREKVKEEYRFNSLMKQKKGEKKAKIALPFALQEKYFFYL